MTNKIYFMDWAHENEKQKFRSNGKLLKSKPKLKKGDKLFTENISMKTARPLLETGVEVYRCNCHIVADYREQHGLEKGDIIDVGVIEELYNNNPSNFQRWNGTPNITGLYRLFMETQKVRVADSNRQWIFADNDEYNEILEQMNDREAWILKKAKKELSKFPIYTKYLVNIKGMGISHSLGLIGIIENKGIENFNQASSLRHYMGVYPMKHPTKDIMVAAQYFKGVNADFSSEHKSRLLGRVAPNLIKAKDFYKGFYDKYKQYQLNKVYEEGELENIYYKKPLHYKYKYEDTQIKLYHADKRARRRMIQLFLDHTWCVWRQLEGLNTRTPYPIEKLGHKTYINPPYIPEELKPFDPFR